MIRITRAEGLDIKEFKMPPIQADNEIEKRVDEIIAQVRSRGDEVLREYARKFDRADIQSVLVTEEEIQAAFDACDPALIDTMTRAAENIRDFHKNQLRAGFSVSREGVVLGQKVLPLERVGVYVPGGTASYPSTVLMDVIPPKLAGVEEIVMTTPPGPDGSVAPVILAAARIAGADKIVKSGGAQAVAALAYGTESVPAVDKIVGPGNVYVATAKRRVFGVVDIDMIAGPSEILVIADEKSEAREVAADMLSQAEHDKMASAILITPSEALAEEVAREIEAQLKTLEREEIARASIEGNGRIILVEDLAQAMEISNQIAPEHLELCVEEPFALLGAVKSAGSVFLGRSAPEALGDYWAGLNHTLPTSGTARFSSPLSVDDFVKTTQYVYYSQEALGRAKDSIVAFARREGLTGHAASVTVRFGEMI